MKKAILSLFLAAAVGATLCGCGEAAENGGEVPGGDEEEIDLLDFKLTEKYFANKNVVVYGDSITVPAAKTSHISGDNYIDLLAKDLGWQTYWNYAIAGTSATHTVSVIPTGAAKENLESGPRYVDQHPYENSIADYAIIMYGANDFGLNAPIGAASDDPQTYEECSTFLGGINYMVKKIRGENPDIKILLLGLLWADRAETNALGLTRFDYIDALQDNAGRLKCRFIDVYPVFSAQNFKQGQSDLTSDGVHPTEKGHEVLEQFLLDKEK